MITVEQEQQTYKEQQTQKEQEQQQSSGTEAKKAKAEAKKRGRKRKVLEEITAPTPGEARLEEPCVKEQRKDEREGKEINEVGEKIMPVSSG